MGRERASGPGVPAVNVAPGGARRVALGRAIVVFALLAFIAPVSWAVTQIGILLHAGPGAWRDTFRATGYEERMLRNLSEGYGGDLTFYLRALKDIPLDGPPVCLTAAATRALFSPEMHWYETNVRQFRRVRGACPVPADGCVYALLAAPDACHCPDGVTCRSVGQ